MVSPGPAASDVEPTSTRAAPRVWALCGRRAGDNAQVLRLAGALGWPFEVKELAYNRRHVLPNELLGATVASLDRAASSALEPPWPDLVLAIGKRSVPAARWIRRQAGGRTRLVQLGRPRAALADFDLVITTPQYRLPPRDNVLQLTLPLSGAAAAADATAAGWAPAFAHLPRPLLGLLVGGDSSSYRLPAAAARDLGRAASAAARERGGSLLVATSPRTPRAAAEALAAEISVPAYVHLWSPEAEASPYPGILAHADSFIVTAESASLLADACATGRPVLMSGLPARWHVRLRRLWRARRGRAPGPPAGRWAAWLAERGLVSPPRDLEALHEVLIRRGCAAWLGGAGPVRGSRPPDDLERAVTAVGALLHVPAGAAARMDRAG